MKNIVCSLCLLPLLGYAGGNILPIEENYDEMLEIQTSVVMEPKQDSVVIKPIVERIKSKIIEKSHIKPSPFYIGLSVGRSDMDGTSSTTILKNGHPTMAIASIGYNLLDNLALEGRAGLGIQTQNIDFSSSKMDKLVAAYLKPNMDISEDINLYGLLGYAKVEQTIGGNESLVTSGVSYGIGGAYGLTDALSLTLDAVRYANKSTERVDAYSLGLNYNF